MTSINTNLSSMIVQKNLTKSTSALNQAIERLTTGYKINHASDNAANYSISESMTSKLSSYMVAEENTSMGLDLIRTQSSTLDTIQNLTTRLRALAEQAHNGTYGAQSLSAINQEANAIISEIERIGNNAEYNGIKLFDNAISEAGIPQLKSNGLMQEIERRDTSGMTKLADVDENAPLAAGTYSISSAEELAKLATMQNNGNITAGSEFVLGADIDLSAYSEGNGWDSIGKNNYDFTSTFDGNGHTITNLQGEGGLFYAVRNSTIKNVILSDISLCGTNISAGCLVDRTASGDISISNCSVSGNITNDGFMAGLLVGMNTSLSLLIENCYSSGSVVSAYSGGIIGIDQNDAAINHCYSEATVNGTEAAGGICSSFSGSLISNSAFTGSISGETLIGGLVGQLASTGSVQNCLFAGNIEFAEDADIGIFAGSKSKNSTINGMYDSYLVKNYDFIGQSKYADIGTEFHDLSSLLQVGVDSTDSSIIKFTTNLSLFSVSSLGFGGMEGANSLERIDSFISKLSEAQTRLGAIENRLTSTIESIGVNIENLTSSRSTLKDADVAKESSQLLKNQILQQAAATLLSTANQTPALSLRLLGGV